MDQRFKNNTLGTGPTNGTKIPEVLTLNSIKLKTAVTMFRWKLLCVFACKHRICAPLFLYNFLAWMRRQMSFTKRRSRLAEQNLRLQIHRRQKPLHLKRKRARAHLWRELTENRATKDAQTAVGRHRRTKRRSRTRAWAVNDRLPGSRDDFDIYFQFRVYGSQLIASSYRKQENLFTRCGIHRPA